MSAGGTNGSFYRGAAIGAVAGLLPIAAVVLFGWLYSTTTPSTSTVTAAQPPAATTATTGTTAATGTTTAATGATTAAAASSDPHVVAGGYNFVQFACDACHGTQGQGGVSPYVPSLTTAGSSFTAEHLKSIIDHGLGASANPTRPYMPVWGAVISQRQAADLVAYIKAGLPPVGAAPRAVPSGSDPAVEGSILYDNYGCVNCHGPNGLGGVPNPASPDRTVPPLSGAAFRKQFNTDAKIAAVIESGSVIGRAPIVSMPHWGTILTKDQIAALVAYIHTLR
jgi:mono/diheme cytochrome c family protein